MVHFQIIFDLEYLTKMGWMLKELREGAVHRGVGVELSRLTDLKWSIVAVEATVCLPSTKI